MNTIVRSAGMNLMNHKSPKMTMIRGVNTADTLSGVRIVAQEKLKSKKKIKTLDAYFNKLLRISLMSENDILGKSRKMKLAATRQFWCYICKVDLYDEDIESLTNIGKKVNRSHATVIYAHNTVSELLGLNYNDEKVEYLKKLNKRWHEFD
jgi:chromosomal replication initiation ATPase DnaA